MWSVHKSAYRSRANSSSNAPAEAACTFLEPTVLRAVDEQHLGVQAAARAVCPVHALICSGETPPCNWGLFGEPRLTRGMRRPMCNVVYGPILTFHESAI